MAAERPSALEAAKEIRENGSRPIAGLDLMDDAAPCRCHICKMRVPSAPDWVSEAALPQVPCMHSVDPQCTTRRLEYHQRHPLLAFDLAFLSDKHTAQSSSSFASHHESLTSD